MRTKKSADIIIRSMSEGVLLAVLLLIVVVYVLYTSGHLVIDYTWEAVLRTGIALLIPVLTVGILYGLYQALRLKMRLGKLRDTLLMWEKGSWSQSAPEWGSDEWARLGEQMDRIGKKWGDQISSLQRLSTNNAQLAEQARISAIIEERQRLARELHDAVSQQLFAISMTATAVGRTFDKDLQRAKRQVELIEEMSSVAQSEMRALLLHLRPVYLEGKRLYEGIQELVQELQAKIPMEIALEMDEDVRLLKGVENHLFRIVQEALSNTLRHAKASRMEIRIVQKTDSVRVTLRDDGIGFELDDTKQTSYGLSTMRERINEIGGTIQYITAPGKGTRIEIVVPIVTLNTEESRWT
ncbi:sensor histidine kinase [Paenibacillus wulumuqiensis]|uniref:sensor histidine kinase n=1 Tax=Paenibacillus wulumuqiensis TaxID=1567107 RepID=UPI000619D2AB|nr:sensor histidine kinase [Paenibacillus wulumuqiensis]